MSNDPVLVQARDWNALLARLGVAENNASVNYVNMQLVSWTGATWEWWYGVGLLLDFNDSCIINGTINEEYKVYGLYSLYALIVFTILATILYHKPMSGSFYSHLSIIGGLLALLIVFQK